MLNWPVRTRSLVLIIASIVTGLISLNPAWHQNLSEAEYAAQISDNLSRHVQILELERDKIFTNPEATHWATLQGIHVWADSTTVLAWSQHEHFPDLRLLQDSVRLRLLQSTAGDFIVLKQPGSGLRALYSVLPLTRRYPITNKYLSTSWNQEIFGAVTGRIVGPEINSGWTVSLNSTPIFKILQPQVHSKTNWISLVIGLASLGLWVMGLGMMLLEWHRQHHYARVFLLGVLAFVLVRVGMVYMNIPGRWMDSPVFNPQAFASSVYNSSMGNLVLNSGGVLMLCAYLFYTYSRWRLTRKILSLEGWKKFFVSSFLLLIVLLAFLYPFLFIETIFNNSAISLDITQTLTLDALRLLAYLSLLIGTLSSFLFLHPFLRLSRFKSFRLHEYGIALLLALVCFISYFLWEGRNYWITVSVIIPFILLVNITGLNFSLKRVTYRTFLYFFLALTAFSIQASFSIKRFIEEERAESQFRFASSYLIDRDVMAEYLLNESARRIARDAFIQTRFSTPFLSKSVIREKVRQVYLNSYLDRYEVRIYVYSGNGLSLEGLSQPDFQILENEITNSANATEYKAVFFIRPVKDNISKRYFVKIPILRSDQPVGFIVIDLSLKRIIPQRVFPELLVDSRFSEYFQNRDKSFAFISGQKIISASGNFNYDRDFNFTQLENPSLYRSGIKEQGYIHTALEDEQGRVAVVTARGYPSFYVFTNFSFFFVLGILIVGLLISLYGLLTWITHKKVNYAARIQLYIYGAFAIPLILITVTTLNRVSVSVESQMKQEYQTRTRVMGENLVSLLSAYQQYPDSLRSVLENEVAQIARFSDVDLTLYDTLGRLLVSSQPEITENQLSSVYINRIAWERIRQSGSEGFVLNEKIGSLQFSNAYVGLRSPEMGLLVGILSVPFFESGLSLEATQITVLANILTVFVVVFILFSLLSFIVVDSLTFPLRLITRTLSRTTLTGKNEPLTWKSNDEIGWMIKEYNKMVENLERSKLEMERIQKESAWREIAKQVAHEIKNPLTPMKLTLQQMEYALQKGDLHTDKTKQSVNTLLTQVEILNDIASSFSSFARMPAPTLQRIELIAIVKKAVDLFADEKSGLVRLTHTGSQLYIMGDDQLLSRVFSNLILNGLQAAEGKLAKVDVEVTHQAGLAVISIQDNGTGIAPENYARIFTPYFSSKKSGSGLGLAIAKQGVEQCGGEIGFESQVGKGSRFFVRLPVMEVIVA